MYTHQIIPPKEMVEQKSTSLDLETDKLTTMFQVQTTSFLIEELNLTNNTEGSIKEESLFENVTLNSNESKKMEPMEKRKLLFDMELDKLSDDKKLESMASKSENDALSAGKEILVYEKSNRKDEWMLTIITILVVFCMVQFFLGVFIFYFTYRKFRSVGVANDGKSGMPISLNSDENYDQNDVEKISTQPSLYKKSGYGLPRPPIHFLREAVESGKYDA